MVSRFPRASLHWYVCLLVSQPGFGPQVLSVSPGVSLHLNGFICFPLWLVVSPFWVLSGSPGVSLYVSSFMCLPFWPVVSAVRMSSLCFPLAAIIFAYHLSPNSPPYSGGVWFSPCFSQSVSHFICLPIHMSPLVAVSCSCFIAISFVIGPYSCSFLPLCLVVVSAVAPAHTPDSNKMEKGFLWFMLFSPAMD